MANLDVTYEVATKQLEVTAVGEKGARITLMRRKARDLNDATAQVERANFAVDAWAVKTGTADLVFAAVNPRRAVRKTRVSAAVRRALRIEAGRVRCPCCNSMRLGVMSFYPPKLLCSSCGADCSFDYAVDVVTNHRTWRGRRVIISNVRQVAWPV